MKSAEQAYSEFLDLPATANAVDWVRRVQLDAAIDGLTRFAWWKDGKQYVGTCGTTLAQAIGDLRKELE